MMRLAVVIPLAFVFIKYVHCQEITLVTPTDVTEGTNPTATLTVQADMMIMGADLTATVTVDMTTANTQAAPGYDFGGTGTYTATIAVGATTDDIIIAIEDDTLDEMAETVTIVLDAVSGGGGSPTIGAANTVNFDIIDNSDTDKVQINFAASTYEAAEGGSVTLQLDFTDSAGQPTVINELTITANPTLPREVTQDTATVTTDYGSPTGNTVTFPFDLTTTSVTLTAISLVNDASAEPTEIFYVSLGAFSDGTYTELGTLRPTAAVRIQDDDTEALICVAATPETFRGNKADFVFYAFASLTSDQASIGWSNSDLPSRFGTLANEGSYGKLLKVQRPPKNNKRRFGAYTFTATGTSGATLTCKSLIKAKSNILNYPDSMAQKYALVIYPSTAGGTTLSPAVTFGVAYNDPGRRNNLIWEKDGIRIPNTRSTLRITDTSAAGVYMISRHTRGNRGWFALIEVIAAGCPLGLHKNGGTTCTTPCETCYNGGICDESDGKCLCPPCFEGKQCELVATSVGTFGMTNRFSCASLGLDSTCGGVLFSYERNYGCGCGCGWSGTDCLTPCPVGTFGADCSQTCHCFTPSACDVRTGQCTDGLGCATGFDGDNCQLIA